MAIKSSLKVMSTTSICNYTVALCASNSPLATLNWNSGGGTSFSFVCGASIRILRKMALWRCLTKYPGLWSPRCLAFWSPKESIDFCTHSPMVGLLIVGITSWVRLVLPGAVVKFGRQWPNFAVGGFMVYGKNHEVVLYQVIVGLLSTSQLMRMELHLIHVSA